MASDTLEKAPLGQKSTYESHYNPEFLFPIARINNRNELAVPTPLPFKGMDIWNAFEISWLNTKGKPMIAIGEFHFPCESPNIVESKSLKLYLNSFNNSQFESLETVNKTIERDLTKQIGAPVTVQLSPLDKIANTTLEEFKGLCIDNLDIHCEQYQVEPSFLTTDSDQIVEETLYSNLLKSNCLVTGQPDWGSVHIQYRGRKIDPKGLLKYIVSFRNHNEFGEQCAERIFMDISKYCKPEKLTIHTRYTRRGGLDINSVRSTEIVTGNPNLRLTRQ